MGALHRTSTLPHVNVVPSSSSGVRATPVRCSARARFLPPFQAVEYGGGREVLHQREAVGLREIRETVLKPGVVGMGAGLVTENRRSV